PLPLWLLLSTDRFSCWKEGWAGRDHCDPGRPGVWLDQATTAEDEQGSDVFAGAAASPAQVAEALAAVAPVRGVQVDVVDLAAVLEELLEPEGLAEVRGEGLQPVVEGLAVDRQDDVAAGRVGWHRVQPD